MFRLLLFVGFLAGLWSSLEEANGQNLDKDGYTRSLCYNTSSGKTCFATLLANPVRKPFKTASDWCKQHIPGSSLIIIDSLKSLRNVENFIENKELANETIIIDARKLSARDRSEWSWVDGHPTVPMNVRTVQIKGIDGACVESKHKQALAYCTGVKQSPHHYICEYSDSKCPSSYRQNNKSYNVSEGVATWYDARNECLRLGGDLASITDLKTIENWSQLKENQNQRYWIGLHRNKWIWNNTGTALTYTNWEGGFPNETPNIQCICINPQCRRENNRTICGYDRKWKICNCSHDYAIVCQTTLSLSLEETQSQNSYTAGYTSSLCCNISSGKTSFTTFLAIGSHPVRELNEEPSHWCNSAVPDGHKGIAEASTPSEVDGRKKKRDVSADQFHDGVCVESKHGQSMAYCVGHVKSQYRYICEYAGTAITYNPNYSQEGHREDSSDKQCICIDPICKRKRAVDELEYELKWRSCSCKKYDAIVCRTEENSYAVITEVAATDDRLPSTPAGLVLLILLVFVAVAFIVVAVIFIIRKRKYAGRNEVSSLKTTAQNEAVHPVYETMVRDNTPSDDIHPIYTKLEMTQQPKPSNNTTYASIQPTSEVVVIGKSVDYVDIDLPNKDQQKPKSADKGTVSVSPIYSQPFDPPTSDSNTDYVEPYKPDVKPTATAPVESHQAATDQQNVYSLAKAIPLVDPNAVYSEPNKPTKSSTPTDKARDPIYLNVIEVKPGAESEGIATQDPSTVYSEPIKLKKSP